MLKYNNLQKKLLSISFVMIGAAIIAITCAVLFIEKNRYQEQLFLRIYHSTFALKETLLSSVQKKEIKDAKDLLSKLQSSDPSFLYYALSHKDGRVVVSGSAAKYSFDIATIEHIDQPLYKTANRFVIYTSRLSREIKKTQGSSAEKNEKIFDCFWDISQGGEQLGILRMGFSRRPMKNHLLMVASVMFLLGFFVLLSAAAASFLILKNTTTPVQQLALGLQRLTRKDTQPLHERLAQFHIENSPKDPEEIFRLKKAMVKLIGKIVADWDRIDEQAHDLETRLERKDKTLRQTKQALFHQSEERKEIETRLLNVQKLEAIGTLAGGIAHEFNNLFMAITGYASLIQKQSEPGHSNITKAQKILGLVDKGSQSVKQLLGFARSGKYTPGTLDINEVIRMNLDMFKKTRKDLTIHAKYTKDIWDIFADRSQMEHVIMNLLLNASESMPENGQVTIQTSNIVLEKKKVGMDKIVSGRFVHFFIQDQGKGIETKYLRRVFDPFFTTKPLSEGSGLGLASVYGIVDNHDGFTTVESMVGKGTIFNVFLPAIKDEE